MVRAPVEAVFDLVHDYRRRLEWDPFLREARLLDGAPCAGPGVRTLCTAKLASGGLAMETEYVSFERPYVAAVRMTRGPALLGSFAASIRQEAVGPDATRVTYTFHVATRPRLLAPLAAAWFALETRRRLERLKLHLERAPAREQAA